MSFLIYNVATTRIVRSGHNSKAYYETAGAAKAALTRLIKSGKLEGYINEYAVSDTLVFGESIEKYEMVKNIMSGVMVRQSVNTPHCCDVSSETYWSM